MKQKKVKQKQTKRATKNKIDYLKKSQLASKKKLFSIWI